LDKWRQSPKRKTLVLTGARQVGKTTVLKEFGKRHFKNVAYFNFELQQDLHQIFASNISPKSIIEKLTLLVGEILPEETLLIFDEAQACRPAITSLKYFCENSPQYVVVAAGSLLGLSLGNNTSFPVGKVDFLKMYPLSFEEFLLASNKNLVAAYDNYAHQTTIEKIPDVFFNPLMDLFKQYILSGGMPEVAEILHREKDIEAMQLVQQNILNAYRMDFSKYADERISIKINHLWDSLPSQLARENKKFLYQTIKSGARAREYEAALLWLQQAGLIYKVHKITKPAMPLKAYQDLTAFKLYLLDAGLLGSLSNLYPQAYVNGNRLFTEFKGALIENYIAQCLQMHQNTDLFYWTSNRSAEVDFLIQHQNDIIPVEVKSDLNVRSKSLAFYKKMYQPKIRLRFSAKNLTLDNDLLNIPLFMADQYANFLKKIF